MTIDIRLKNMNNYMQINLITNEKMTKMRQEEREKINN